MERKYRLSIGNLIFSVVILFVSFTNVWSQDNISIEGDITNIDVSEVQLIKLMPKQVIATAVVEEGGKFRLNGNITEETIYQLNLAEGKYLMLILGPGENVKMKVDGNNLSFPDIEGSLQTEKLYSTIREYHAYDERIESYRQQMLAEKDAYIKNFLENDSSLATLFFGDRVPIEPNLETYDKALKNLKAKYPDNYFVQDLEKRLNSFSLLAVNTEMPEISLPNPDGDTLHLSDYRGDIVLVDFWASWCGPCRQANPHLVQLYDKYNDKGFEIFGVSLDRSRDAWVGGIEADNLTWPQVSDLKYWNSSVVKDFGISGIPFTVLLDRRGKIIAKGLRGQELENALEEIFVESESQ